MASRCQHNNQAAQRICRSGGRVDSWGGLIPAIDASKIISGLFPISRIGNLQDTLDALDQAAANNPKAQGLIDKICNSLGIRGTGHTAAEAYNALMHIPGPNIGPPIGAGNVPMIDASMIGSGQLAKALFPNLTRHRPAVGRSMAVPAQVCPVADFGHHQVIGNVFPTLAVTPCAACG